MAVIRKIKLPSEAAARDIGALSSNVIYDGDSGVTTTLNDKIQSIFTAIGDINSFEIAIVNELPATGDDHTIYFVPESAGSTSHNEYMYIDNHWELIGSTTIDLSDYVTETELTTALTPYVQTSALTTTLDDRYVNVTGDTMTGNLKVASTTNDRYTEIAPDLIVLNTGTTLYGGVRLETFNAVNHVGLGIVSTKGSNVKTEIRGITTPASADEYHAASKGYVDAQINAVTSTIPTITPVALLTTGITIGSIDVSGTTTTFYAPNDDNKLSVGYISENSLFVPNNTGYRYGSGGDYTGTFYFVVPSEPAPLMNTANKTISKVRIIGTNNYADISPSKTFTEPGLYRGYVSDNSFMYEKVGSSAPTYTLSMTGPTINLLADGVAASTITLPIWDGTLD